MKISFTVMRPLRRLRPASTPTMENPRMVSINSSGSPNARISGREFKVRKGAMIIEVADAAGIRIPRFCYHKKLSSAANCRRCLVEVEMHEIGVTNR